MGRKLASQVPCRALVAALRSGATGLLEVVMGVLLSRWVFGTLQGPEDFPAIHPGDTERVLGVTLSL